MVNFVGSADHSAKKGVNKGEREKLGVAPVPKPRSASRTPPPEPTNAMQKVEVSVIQMLWVTIHLCINFNGFTNQTGIYLPSYQNQMEKAKQDDALSDLSNILGDLKGMAVDMGSELDRLVALY